MMELDFILRIFIASLLGGAIGLEREYRDKAAGFRTHFLVALGSALFMIISVYGFEGVLTGDFNAPIRLDVSRIAAQVVTGIGFIGAGTIIFQKNAVRGLTTAAGVWVTAAIGMACGGGMYLLAAVSTLLVLIGLEAFNFFLHRFDRRRDHTSSLGLLLLCLALPLTACSQLKRGDADAKKLEHPIKSALSFHEVYAPNDYLELFAKNAAGMDFSPSMNDNAPVVGYIAEADSARFMEITKKPEFQQALPDDAHIMISSKKAYGNYYDVFLVKQSPNLSLWNVTLNDIRIETSEYDGRPIISLQLGESDAQHWATMTRTNIGQYIAITFKDRLLMAPRVNSEITGGAASIAGDYTKEELEALVSEITAGTE